MVSKTADRGANPCEAVDPHKGSYQSMGIVVGYEDANGKGCARKNASTIIIEQTGHFIAPWSLWAEEYAYKIQAFPDDDVDSPENKAARLNSISAQGREEYIASFRKVS